MTKTKRKKKTKTKRKRRPSTTWNVTDRLLTRRVLETVKDEIADLAAVFNSVPLLRKLADVMHDIQHPPPSSSASDRANLYRSHDRIGRAAIEYFGVSLNEHLSKPGIQLVAHTYDLTRDMHDAIDDLTEAIRWRLYRLEALIEVMRKQKPRQ